MRKLEKKHFTILAVSLVVLICIIIIICLINSKSFNQKGKLEKLFTAMTVEYYENFYYNQIGSTKEEREVFLKKYTKTGIQISLDSLSRYNSEVNTKRIENFVNLKTNEKCNTKNTISILYPKEPYEKDSYEIKIKLDCGFTK